VNYLDLRGATVAQACDWLLLPLRMTWQPSPQGKSLIAGTCRRLPGQSPWIYDVSLIAWPTKDELSAEADGQKRIDNATQSVKKLVQVVQTLGRTAKLPHVSWFSPGELLVVATADQHAELDRLLSDLTNPESKLGKEAAALRAVTSKRAQLRMPDRKKQEQAETLGRTMAELQRANWGLLSSARKGLVDQESLTELQIAWSNPTLAAMVADGRESLGLLRSAWVVNEAASLLPHSRELNEFATQVRLKTQGLAAKAIATAQDSTKGNLRTIVQAVYAALIYRQDEKLLKECVQAMRGHVQSPELGAIASLMLAILQPKATESESTLINFAGSGVQGPDLVVLLHWACQQAGPKASTAFREHGADWLSAQPLPGEVVVLVNR
jgi:hypothetical protein